MSDPVVPSSDADSPAVVAVVVTQSPAVDLEATLRSLQLQDYPNLSILVIDDGGGEPLADRVAAVLPEAFYHRLSRPVGFAGAANHAATLVTGGSFLLFCTDRVDLDPRCVRGLVEELYRSNAGIVTPKSRQWDDPRRLESIGMGSDRFGVQVDLVESGDFDQEQYDAVTDVFVAPAGVQLVRADLFRALDGFDPAMGSVNEDLDFCWRAHLAGARVVAVPSAIAKRRTVAFGDTERRPLERNRLRTLLVTQSRLTLLWLLPLAVLQLVAGGLYSLLSGHRAQATVALDAVAWNFSRWGDTRKRRKAMQALRQVSDSEVHALQFVGSARINTFLRGQFAVGDRVVNLVTTIRDAFAGPNADRVRDASIVGALLGFLVLFGSRDLISQGVTPVGQFLELPGAGRLLGEWSSGWRAAGTGGPGTAPTAFLVLGLLRVVFFWADGVPALLLTLGPIVAGVVGMWTLVRPLGSARAASLASLSYTANPLLVDIVHAGRWNALVVWAAGPAMLASALRLQGRSPYGRVGGTMHDAVVDRAVATRVLRFGLLVAAVSTFVPAFVLIALGVLFAVGFSSIIVARPVGLARLGVGAVAAVFVPGALHAPFTFDVLRRFDWNWLVGPSSSEATFDSLADLIRFAPGIGGIRTMVIGLLLAAGVVMAVGRGVRFDTGALGWGMAAVFWMIAWSDRRGWLPFEVPAPELLLVPAAVGIALAIGAGTCAVENDLRGHRFGWRQAVAFGGTASIAAAGLLLVQASLSGRWELPQQSHTTTVRLMAGKTEGLTRVLWLGQPSVLPVDAHESVGGVSFAVTDGRPDALDRWVPGTYGFDAAIGERLDLAAEVETSRLGRSLAPYGIDMIVVVPTIAPAPFVGVPTDPGGGIVDVLPRQLDLERVPGTPDLSVYRNNASNGALVNLAADALPADGAVVTQLDTDLSVGTRVSATETHDSDSYEGPIEPQELVEPTVLIAVPAADWEASGGDELSSTLGGLLSVSVGEDGAFDVSYPTSFVRRFGLVGQVVLVAGAFYFARARRARPVGDES